MKKVNWLVVSLIAIVALLAIFWAGTMFGGGYGGYGMMGGWGNRGYGMMNWGYSPLDWFGMGLGMIFMWLIPIGILALIIFGITLVVRSTGNSSRAASLRPCPNCGKGTQADWQHCPYCSTALK